MHYSFFSSSSLLFYITEHKLLNYNENELSLFKSVCSLCRTQNYSEVLEASFCFYDSNLPKSLSCGLNECIWWEDKTDRKSESFCEHKYLGKSAMM